MSAQTEHMHKEKQRVEAARWHALMQSGGESESDWLAFTAWLAEGDNNQAYAKLVEAMALVEDEKDTLRDMTAEVADDDPAKGDNVIRLPLWRKTGAFGTPRILAAAAAIAATFLVFTVMTPGGNIPPQAIHYETASDARQRVELADGSVLHLNVNTSIEVSLGEDERHTTLTRGEALFEVAPDKERPFFVHAGDQQIRVVGTVFNVLRHEGAIAVTVSEGIVDVTTQMAEATGTDEPKTDRLTAGKQLTHAEGSNERKIALVDAGMVTAWQVGQLVYDSAPLSQVASDLNRYFKTQITVDPAIGDMPFSGVLNVEDQASILLLLGNTMKVKISRTDAGFLIGPEDQ